MRSYIALKNREAAEGRTLDWTGLKKWLKGKYDSPLRVESLRNELRNIPFKGNLAGYSEKFRQYESQIPESEMTFGDRLSHFLSHLPADIARDLRREKPKNTEEMYHNAREWDRLTNVNRGHGSSGGQQKKSKGNNSKSSTYSMPRRFTDFQGLTTSLSSSGTTTHPNAPVPMDLDAMYQPRPMTRKDDSRVRCYNCNRPGHLAKQCRFPKKKGPSPVGLHACEQEPISGEVRDHTEDYPFLGEGILPSETMLHTMLGEPTLHIAEQHADQVLPAYDVKLASWQGKNVQCARALMDTGAGPSYIKPQVARMVRAEFFPITPRRVLGAGSTTTSAFARFQLLIGSMKYPMYAYVLDDNQLKYGLIVGRNFLKRHNAQPNWQKNSWRLTDPRSGLRVELEPSTPAPLTDRPVPVTHTSVALNIVIDEEKVELKKNLGERLKSMMKTNFGKIFRTKVGYPPSRPRWTHHIDTPSLPMGQTLCARGRPLSPLEHNAIREFVEEGLRDGIIEPSESSWSSPLLPVRKKDGKLRICVDYRALNAVTKRNAYPLPRIDDSYQNLAGAKYFTSLDLRSGYWQVRLADDAKPKTAFQTRFGHYQFRVMPFGLVNAPATFQNMMNDILRNFLDRFVMVYLDDIIIYSQTWEQHCNDVEQVLRCLADQDLVLNEDKCIWGARELVYLGHIVSGEGIRPNPDKISAVLSWPRPQTITQVRGFLNLAGYYRRFIKSMAKLARPILDLLKGNPRKGSNVEWTPECEQSFRILKEKLTSPPLLSHPRPWQIFVIDSDASGDCIGGVLQQSATGKTSNEGVGDDRYAFSERDLRPIAYESRRLTPTEQRYSAQEREMLAIDYLLQKWRAYIEGSPVVVRTDHESLKYFLSQKHLGRRLARFADNIAHFDVKIIYRPGKHQLAADALSRREGEDLPDSETIGPLFAYPLDNDDDDTEHLYDDLEQEIFGSSESIECVATEEDSQPSPQLSPDERARQAYDQLFEWMMNLRNRAESGQTEPDENGFFYRNDNMYRVMGDRIYVVPLSFTESEELVRNVHCDLGHIGIRAVSEAVKERAWIPNLTEVVDLVIRSCPHCQFTRSAPTPSQPLHPLPRVGAWDRWAMDFVGPLPVTPSGNAYLITAMDHGTGWTYAVALSRRSADAVIFLLRKIIAAHGKPMSVLTDNGEEFMSYQVQNFLRRLGINHIHTTPYHPQTNGRLERFNYELEQMLMRFVAPGNQNQWDTYVDDALLAHRAHVNSSTGTSAFYLAYGTLPRLPHDLVIDVINTPPSDEEISQLRYERLEQVRNLEDLRTEANVRALRRLQNEANRREDTYRERALGIGDLVLRRSESPSKIHPRWDGPFIVHDLTDKNTYQLATRNGYILRHLYNGERLKKYVPSKLVPNSKLWYASADLQRKDAAARMKEDAARRRAQTQG
ncbi:hypothetical protein EVJ58_g10744 [Rhodofomes roseus]|uniref:RNA-directed DNA polymerase n=1 Tax=Rhodofomes roseus TaxID=34475 RepID=A0A4Y9XMW3_9APHY|nr:hypothetical protein EVJ58_g10744 [Rhodofomes roseus]